MCVCVREGGEGAGGEAMFDDKFVYVNIVCFDVVFYCCYCRCFLLLLVVVVVVVCGCFFKYEMYTCITHSRKGALRPHYSYFFKLTAL